MGFDITYHPIKEEEIFKWYFNALKDENIEEKARETAKPYDIDEFYVEKYIDVLKVGIDVNDEEIFDKTHGFYTAVIQGFFRKYFYIRGGAFSFLIEKDSSYKRYTKKWEDMLQNCKYVKIKNHIENKITENYTSGVYIPYESVISLLKDYKENKKVKEDLDYIYSYGRIDVFLHALEFAKENECGLLEATEVTEVNPLDLNKSECYSNLFNCDIEGALLYEKAALEQIKEAGGDPSKASYNKIFPNDSEDR